MHTQPRSGPIEVIVVHDNEGPRGPGAAQGLVNFLQTIDGGYHAVSDNDVTLTAAADDIEVWGNGAINNRSLDICLIGYASEPWSDAGPEIHQAAVWVAGKCQAYSIPPVWLDAQQLNTPGVKGLCTHWDLTLAGYVGTLGHTDPGQYFPRDPFLSEVKAILNPAPVYKVAPMFEPPLQIAAFLARPGGGIWLAADDGVVLYVDTSNRVTLGGMISPADRKAFEGRHVAQLKPRRYGPLLGKAGYTIVATSGETYIPQPQT